MITIKSGLSKSQLPARIEKFALEKGNRKHRWNSIFYLMVQIYVARTLKSYLFQGVYGSFVNFLSLSIGADAEFAVGPLKAMCSGIRPKKL